MNLVEVAQKLIDELHEQSYDNEKRAEGVRLLFDRIRIELEKEENGKVKHSESKSQEAAESETTPENVQEH